MLAKIGQFFVWFFSVITRGRENDRKDFESIVRECKALYETLKKELEDCRHERDGLRSRVASLERRVAELEKELIG